jgi:HEAT repeat protein
MLYDSFVGFTDEHYYQNMYEQWKKKSSNFLLAQLSIFNDEPRFSTAAFILTERNEKRAIKRLRAILNSRANSKIKRTAIFRLVNFDDKESINSFMKKAYAYRQINLDFYDKSKSDSIDEYRDILQALSSVQSEKAYPLVLDLAKNGNHWEKAWAFTLCLHYYKTHSQEIISMYENYFFSKLETPSSPAKDNAILGLVSLGDTRAIPVLKNIAEKEPEYRREADRAISLIESSQSK